MGWNLVGSKSVSISVKKPPEQPPEQLPEHPKVLSWDVTTDRKVYTHGDTITLKIKVTTGSGNVPVPLFWEVNDWDKYISSQVEQEPNTTKEYSMQIPVPSGGIRELVIEGEEDLYVTMYKGVTEAVAPEKTEVEWYPIGLKVVRVTIVKKPWWWPPFLPWPPPEPILRIIGMIGGGR